MRFHLPLILFGFVLLISRSALSQQSVATEDIAAGVESAEMKSASTVPDAPIPQQTTQQKDSSKETKPADDANKDVEESQRQPKRIMGIMANYRAVSAGAKPPPPTRKQMFVMATQSSFDYSALIFVGFTSLIAEAQDAHPPLGKGISGFWGYTWRGFVDKTDGNYWVMFLLPAIFHEDQRYYALGKGSIWKRSLYSSTRVFITPNFQGHNTFNTSEILGRGIAQGISIAYYPDEDRSIGSELTRYAYAIMRDAGSNAFREFWPDIATHVLHRHP